MIQSADINVLKSLFSLYAPCWQEWRQYQFCGLNAQDNLALEQLSQNNFVVSEQSFNPLLVSALYTKLKHNYPHYQEWVIMKFWFSLIRRLDKRLLDYYFGLSFDDLPLSQEEISILKKFGVSSINQLFQTYTDEDLKKSRLFGLVLQLLNGKFHDVLPSIKKKYENHY